MHDKISTNMLMFKMLQQFFNDNILMMKSQKNIGSKKNLIQMDVVGLPLIPTGSFWQFSSLAVFS